MTVTEIIESNETNMETLDGFTHIPADVKVEIDGLYSEINEKLENLVDEYGDEDDVAEDEEND